MTRFYTILKTDGFGAQFHGIMALIAYCDFYGYTYVHKPLFNIEHGVDPATMNEFIGMKGVTLLKDLPKDAHVIHIRCPNEVHDSKTPSKFYTPVVIAKLRDYYRTGKKPQTETPEIAVHIRRGDVKKDNRQRYTDNAIYKQLIQVLKVKYPNMMITVFSEGKVGDFNDIGLPEANFCLNADIRSTFHSLVLAKVLVCSKSSFSYSAALLNENTIYYQDFWHAKLDNWQHFSELIST